MKQHFLLDVSTLVALLIEDHEFHAAARAWSEGRTLALCPITELGFMRVAMTAYNASQEAARKVLEELPAKFICADLPALEAGPFPGVKQSTDWYLAGLAAKHGLKLATFDAGIKHPAAELVPSEPPPGQ